LACSFFAQFANLVEEQDAAVCRSQQAAPVAMRACIGTALDAEQLGLGQRGGRWLRSLRAIHGPSLRRRSSRCAARAISSLPVPVSPTRSNGRSDRAAARRRLDHARCSAALLPTIPSAARNCASARSASHCALRSRCQRAKVSATWSARPASKASRSADAPATGDLATLSYRPPVAILGDDQHARTVRRSTLDRAIAAERRRPDLEAHHRVVAGLAGRVAPLDGESVGRERRSQPGMPFRRDADAQHGGFGADRRFRRRSHRFGRSERRVSAGDVLYARQRVTTRLQQVRR
jgi:hypothetical protein